MPDFQPPVSDKPFYARLVRTRSAHAGARPAHGPAAEPRRSVARRVLKYVLLTLLAAVLVLQSLIVLYRWVDPPASTLMLGQRLGGAPVRQTWVPLARISPHLIRAVILSEDGQFCRHHGVNWPALERARDGLAGGGSTISMQVAKNLFLWPSKSYLRKAIEIPLTLDLDFFWPKHRTLEIYLNVAEWGPGLFGAEAAAQAYFRKPAEQLAPREAALLAISLPNPAERRASTPSPLMLRLADNLERRIKTSVSHASCVLAQP
jgi:monofunctional glycosyltransferase